MLKFVKPGLDLFVLSEEFNKPLGVEERKLVALITIGYSAKTPKPLFRRDRKVVYLSPS